MKLWLTALIALLSLGALFFLNDQSPKTAKPVTSAFTPPATPTVVKLFNPSAVTQLSWRENEKIMSFKKTGDEWRSGSSRNLPDAWAIQRRLQLLSELKLTPHSLPAKSTGTVSLKVGDKNFEGVFDQGAFVWTVGSQKGNGLTLKDNPAFQTLLGEGLLGFQSHVLNLCGKSSSLQQINFMTWLVEKEKESWFVVEKEKRQTVRIEAVRALEITLCSLHAENYVTTAPPTNLAPVLELGFSEKNKKIVIKQSGVIFYPDGLPAFQSQALLEILKSTHAADLEDPALADAKIALDRTQDQNDRLAAIRRMKTSNSPQAIAALKEILFEKTEIDLYRYEAVDSLAAIGTKEAYKMMNERLAQAGRSGFELRLARALAAAMGRFFRSDEKTSEDVRRPEVDELIQAAKDNPPGK